MKKNVQKSTIFCIKWNTKCFARNCPWFTYVYIVQKRYFFMMKHEIIADFCGNSSYNDLSIKKLKIWYGTYMCSILEYMFFGMQNSFLTLLWPQDLKKTQKRGFNVQNFENYLAHNFQNFGYCTPFLGLLWILGSKRYQKWILHPKKHIFWYTTHYFENFGYCTPPFWVFFEFWGQNFIKNELYVPKNPDIDTF